MLINKAAKLNEILLEGLLVCCLLLSLSSCTAKGGNNASSQQGSLLVVPDKIKDKIGAYEVKSISTNNLELLSKYPTLFELGSMEAKASFDRMLYFFQNYTSSYQPQNIHSDNKIITIESSNRSDSVLYKVKRQIQDFNIRYAVSAADKKNPQKSAILAANLARFIREGQLDLELIQAKK